MGFLAMSHQHRKGRVTRGEGRFICHWGVAEDKWRKLEIPLFSGEEAYGWVTMIERYFQLKGVSDADRVQAIMVAMEGRAFSYGGSLVPPLFLG